MHSPTDLRPETEPTSDGGGVEAGATGDGISPVAADVDLAANDQGNWLANPPRIWVFRHKWMTKQLDCTAHGITRDGGCGGCCINRTYWPPVAGGEEYGYMCPMLGDNGCSFTTEDRPVLCLLYPLKVDARGNVGMHLQATRPNAHCAPCYKQGPMIIDALHDALVAVVGQASYDTVRAGVLAGQDVEVDVPYMTILQLAKEYVWALHGTVPGPRSGGPPPQVLRTRPVILPWRERRDMAKGEGTFLPHPNLLDVHQRHRSTPEAPDRYGAQLEQEALL